MIAGWFCINDFLIFIMFFIGTKTLDKQLLQCVLSNDYFLLLLENQCQNYFPTAVTAFPSGICKKEVVFDIKIPLVITPVFST